MTNFPPGAPGFPAAAPGANPATSPERPVPDSAVLIVNARSRQGDALFAQAKEKLEAAGIRLIEAHAVRNPADLPHIVRAAVESGAPMVIVGGGDGSLSAAVDEVVGSECVFALLPMGTANSFARSLGLPLDLDDAVAAIAGGRRRRIDLGMIGDDYFANAASLGLGPMIAETVPHSLKRYLGRAGYLLWAVRCFFGFRPFRLSVDDGTTVHQLWTSEVRIFNGPFHGGVELSETADVDSGEIVVQVVAGRNRWRLTWDWYAKFFKLRSRHQSTIEFRGKMLKLDSKPRHRISIDGELLAWMPVVVRVAQQAIDVAAPADVPDGAAGEGRP